MTKKQEVIKVPSPHMFLDEVSQNYGMQNEQCIQELWIQIFNLQFIGNLFPPSSAPLRVQSAPLCHENLDFFHSSWYLSEQLHSSGCNHDIILNTYLKQSQNPM